MRNIISRAAIAGIAALSLTASLVATTEPAAAQHHGRGGHARAYHGGGWRGGGWHGGGGWAGPAIVGGLAAGALLAAPYAYGYGYSCQSYYAPVYDAYGDYLGQQLVSGC